MPDKILNTGQAPSAPNFSTMTYDDVVMTVTRDTLDTMNGDQLADAGYVKFHVLENCNQQIEMQNTALSKGKKWTCLKTMLPAQIAEAMVRTYPIIRINASGMDSDDYQDLLGIYHEDGVSEGIYVSSDAELEQIIWGYNHMASSKAVEDTKRILWTKIPRRTVCRDVNLVAVNNGIFDYETKELHPFTPDKVFLTKSRVDYNEHAANVTIHNDADGTDWDVESWMDELSDDPEVVRLLWQIMGAIVRPNVPWNQSAWFYSETGNNGKGTLCELMRQLCGEGSYASIPLSGFGTDFLLEPLIRASAIIVDENDVGTFIDKAANLKAIITGDTLLINRKFKAPIAYAFRGFMVQCLNEMPRVKDKSDSFFRRQIFVPFNKCFTGMERKYIKHDYLHREEVLEYVLHKVLNMDYDTLDVPQSCIDALEEYKSYVDPVRLFLAEFMPKFKWDLLPFTFLYDLYSAWYVENNRGGNRNIQSNASFVKDVRNLIQANYAEWAQTDKTPVRPSDRMVDPEPLIDQYKLEKWMNPLYLHSKDPDARCHPILKPSYRGVYRLVRQQGSDEDNGKVAAFSADDTSVESKDC